MRALIAAVLLLLYAVPASAQTGTPTSWNLHRYIAGSSTKLDSITVTTAQVQCGQVKAGGGALNVQFWRWDDPADTTKDCVYNDASRFNALPDGNYEGTAQASNADGSSAETARVPFTRRRPNPPPAPTGLRFTN